MTKAKPFDIPKRWVWEACLQVKRNRGAAGIDQQSMQQFEENQSKNLYRLWNQLSSGSYFPPAVKAVPIPKKSGGERILGIPTITDRIAQTGVKRVFEPLVEPHFIRDSYGYRPGRSAHDAMQVVKWRCWEYDWVVEFDIKGLFDHIDHERLMRAVHKHCEIRWVVLYIERWLTAPMQYADGMQQNRTKGTPQGGVISPVLANLFLHYALDRWIRQELRSVRLCRYADDGVVHCKSKAQAEYALRKISRRLVECGLEIHPGKTRIVYCKDINRQGNHDHTEFTFLGYSFRPRKSVDKYGRIYPNFTPAASPQALKSMRQTVRSWHLQLKCDKSLFDLSRMFNPILRGWWQYYGRFYRKRR
ncbi:group II intron reverse transcriptase/maturase [Thiothrix nivea]|uniref:RNA-directed DNA polymerase (Reverse transcriptase) n=1 Tax=Thiothrix nivea (strain ATCC 35100 / DSM 5205 / JP2) TaxID=870187 RepID=A0A656HFH2_THINJ|nr:group II intron reverse transcriptase/maturase [Thiothrix nivea]EIJ34246.1 RNA-directed DNA polymerase (Reverse transcriptase) [Thiothrix nivea DSM 5205]